MQMQRRFVMQSSNKWSWRSKTEMASTENGTSAALSLLKQFMPQINIGPTFPALRVPSSTWHLITAEVPEEGLNNGMIQQYMYALGWPSRVQ